MTLKPDSGLTGLAESRPSSPRVKLTLLKKPEKERKGARVLRIIREGFAEERCSLENICITANIEPLTLWRLCQREGWEIPEDAKQYYAYPALDRMIKPAKKTLKAMGARIHKTREYVRQYLRATNQHDTWKAKRTWPTRKKEIVKELSVIVDAELLKRAAQVTDIAQKDAVHLLAWKCYSRIGNRSSLKQLKTLFTTYKQAKIAGKKPSYKELGDRADMSMMNVHYLLIHVGLPSLTERQYTVITRGQHRLLKRARKLKISARDIGYFTGMNMYTAKGKVRRPGKGQLSNLRGHQITYAMASQVYEAKDAGFSFDETRELLDLNKAKLETILDNRKEFAPKIVSTLRSIYQDKLINRPYLSAKHKAQWKKD